MNINSIKLPKLLTSNWPLGVYFIVVHDGQNVLAKENLGLNNWEKQLKSANMRLRRPEYLLKI